MTSSRSRSIRDNTSGVGRRMPSGSRTHDVRGSRSALYEPVWKCSSSNEATKPAPDSAFPQVRDRARVTTILNVRNTARTNKWRWPVLVLWGSRLRLAETTIQVLGGRSLILASNGFAAEPSGTPGKHPTGGGVVATQVHTASGAPGRRRCTAPATVDRTDCVTRGSDGSRSALL